MRVVEKVSIQKRIDDAILQLRMRNKEISHIELTPAEAVELCKSTCSPSTWLYGDAAHLANSISGYMGYPVKVVA